MNEEPLESGWVPSALQHQLLELIYETFRAAGDWPTFQYVSARAWEGLHSEPREIYYQLSDVGFVRPSVQRNRPYELRDDTKVGISLQGLMRVREAADDLGSFVDVVRYLGGRAARWRPSSATEVEALQVTSEEIGIQLGRSPGDAALSRQAALLRDFAWSMWVSLSGPDASGSWTLTIDPERARPYHEIHTVVDFLGINVRIHNAHSAQIGSPAPSDLERLTAPSTEQNPNDPAVDGQDGQEQAATGHGKASATDSVGSTRENEPVPLSHRTIAALAQPFEGGGGPSHSTIQLIWTSADAAEYLGEGNKLDRVLGGLRALRDGRRRAPGQRALPPDHEKLQSVASDLATRLVAARLVDAELVVDALQEERAPPRGTATPRGIKKARGSSVVGRAPSKVRTPRRSPSTSPNEVVVDDPSVVMVVHGQDTSVARAMFDWLRAITLKPRDWSQHVKASGEASPFIGKVLETAFTSAQAVIVLFTPDEHVALRKDLKGGAHAWRLQARPNVLFEAGMAFATHPKRTVLVVLGDQELPTDLAGRHYVRLGSVPALRDLAQRLEQAGCPVDLSGDDWLDVSRFPDRSAITAKPA